MPAKLYRNIPVGDLPDVDWVSAQAVPDDVPNVYTLWSGRAAIEVVAVWWNANAGTAVYDADAVTLQPVEVKSIAADDAVAGVPAFAAVVAATSSGELWFVKRKTAGCAALDAYEFASGMSLCIRGMRLTISDTHQYGSGSCVMRMAQPCPI